MSISIPSDNAIEQRISSLKRTIVEWAKKNELWDEEATTFWSHIEYFDDEPKKYPCLLVLTDGGDLGDLLYLGSGDDLFEEFHKLLESQGIYYEVDSGGVYTFWLSSNDDPQLEKLENILSGNGYAA